MKNNKFFIMDGDDLTFQSVPESLFNDENSWPKHLINNTVVARHDGIVWFFDVHLGNVGGSTVTDVLELVRTIQGITGH